MTWHSYSINTSRSAKSGLPNRAHFHRSNPSVHPSYTTSRSFCPNQHLERRRGKGRGRSCRCIFYCFPGTTALARIYILTSSGASVSTQRRLICLLLYFSPFFGLLELNVNIDLAPYVTHTLVVTFFLFSNLYVLRSPLHAYHSHHCISSANTLIFIRRAGK